MLTLYIKYTVLLNTSSLRRIYHSSRGVLPTVPHRCLWSRNLENEEAKARYRAVENTITMGCNVRETNKQTNLTLLTVRAANDLFQLGDTWMTPGEGIIKYCLKLWPRNFRNRRETCMAAAGFTHCQAYSRVYGTLRYWSSTVRFNVLCARRVKRSMM
jgi:hypothetical protein